LRHEYLDAIQTDLGRVNDEIAHGYFHLHEQQPGPLQAVG